MAYFSVDGIMIELDLLITPLSYQLGSDNAIFICSRFHCLSHDAIAGLWSRYFIGLELAFLWSYPNRNVRKRTVVHESVRPAKIQISLRIRAGWFESSPGPFWIVNAAKALHANNEDSDQIARMRRLIWVFVWRTCQKVRSLMLRLPCIT